MKKLAQLKLSLFQIRGGRVKLLDIMDLQGDIDTLLRDVRRSPFGSEKFKNARPEELQRLVMMTALQFVLFEPHDYRSR